MDDIIEFTPKDSDVDTNGEPADVLPIGKNKVVVGRRCPCCGYAATQRSVGAAKRNLDCPKCQVAKISEFLPVCSYTGGLKKMNAEQLRELQNSIDSTIALYESSSEPTIKGTLKFHLDHLLEIQRKVLYAIKDGEK